MHPEDRRAEDVLDALEDIARCPRCRLVGVFVLFRGQKTGRCIATVARCPIIYFRPDGSFIYYTRDEPAIGPWQQPDDYDAQCPSRMGQKRP